MSETLGPNSLIFTDTNVLLYAHDNASLVKQAQAKRLLKELWENGNGRLSIQVLQEFYAVAIRKLPHLASADLREIVATYAFWVTHSPTPQDVLSAIYMHQRNHLSYWDAMIMHTASLLGCEVIYSEDLNSGQVINGVRIVNPFA